MSSSFTDPVDELADDEPSGRGRASSPRAGWAALAAAVLVASIGLALMLELLAHGHEIVSFVQDVWATLRGDRQSVNVS